MKILVVCQYYYPEPFRLPDICEEMVNRGHEVTVLTGVPNYPMGKIYPGYEKGKKREEIINGVRIIRTFTIPRKTGPVYRLLNYYSYPISAWLKAGKLGMDYDVVFVNQQSPVMMAWPAIRYAKKSKKKIVMYCMDLWPASLAAGGVGTSSPIYKHFYRVSKRVYRSVDRILVTSRMFKGYLKDNFGIEDEKLRSFPQYAENIFEYMEPRQEDGIYNLVFAGNLGIAQSLDTIMEAAEKVKDLPVCFQIIGGGIEQERLKKMKEEKALNNVVFLGQHPVGEMPGYYKNADAMLVTLQADPIISLTLPGKVQTYMAAGRPIIGAIDGEAKVTIEEAQCGFCSKAEDAEGLAENIRKFVGSQNKREMGLNARNYYEEHFERSRFMDKLESELKGAIKK